MELSLFQFFRRVEWMGEPFKSVDESLAGILEIMIGKNGDEIVPADVPYKSFHTRAAFKHCFFKDCCRVLDDFVALLKSECIIECLEKVDINIKDRVFFKGDGGL